MVDADGGNGLRIVGQLLVLIRYSFHSLPISAEWVLDACTIKSSGIVGFDWKVSWKRAASVTGLWKSGGSGRTWSCKPTMVQSILSKSAGTGLAISVHSRNQYEHAHRNYNQLVSKIGFLLQVDFCAIVDIPCVELTWNAFLIWAYSDHYHTKF